MKIVIVAPCPVPYVVGGAEKLWWGLASHFNEATAHQAEIIKLPSPEHDLASLIRSYEAFSRLDLGSFDMVISGKYPAWIVSHPRHVCYMLHRLRGLYDAYPGSEALSPELASHPGVRALLAFMQRYRGARSALAEFFGRWNEMAAGVEKPQGLLDFPGPLARELVHWLDGVALSPSAIKRYAAISATVARRPGYFPEGAEVAVAHPPPHRPLAPGEAFESFYTVGRLDAPKRVPLIVEAYRRVQTSLPLIIGGTGPDEENVARAAAGDARIRLAGYQSDAEVRECYRRALAVPFAPYQEDYGLIATEAMQCARPVITTTDSGGPRELVEDGVNGFVCEPTVEALARAMQTLADDRALAEAMGRRALERASRISWAEVAATLLAEPATTFSPVTAQAGRKLLVASTFSIFPPRHGGQSRIFHLYRALAPEFETVIVSICPAAEPAFEGEIAPGVREVRVPLSAEHERREKKMQAEVGTPIRDVMMARLHGLTPALGEALRREAADACAVVASHPYLYPAIEALGLPIWYEAHNLERALKTALFRDLPRGDEMIATVDEVERASIANARVILCSSPDDALELARSYGADPARIVDAPNGTDAFRIAYTPPQERALLKERLGIDSPMALFLGSGHWPNIEAVKRVFEFAGELPHIVFPIVGSVCYAFDPRLIPPNIIFVGEVDEITRNLCLQACDVALNPMEFGSGTNLKMLDFFAAGLPVITTERGSRGLRLHAESQCLVREIEDFPAVIEEVTGSGAAAAAVRAVAARELVEREFDWEAIARRIKPRLLEALRDTAPA